MTFSILTAHSLHKMKGDTFRLSVDVLNATTPATPFDLTGSSMVMQLRVCSGAPLIAEFKTSDGTITYGANPALGVATITPSLLANDNFDACEWDIKLTDASGMVYTIKRGTLNNQSGITQL